MSDLEKKSIECLKNMPIEETTYQVSRNVILDYITNLQNENEDLKNSLENAVADCNLRLQETEDLKNQVEHLNEFNYENEMYKIRCKRALKLVNNLISDDECFYIYDILESKKQELKHILKGDYDE